MLKKLVLAVLIMVLLTVGVSPGERVFLQAIAGRDLQTTEVETASAEQFAAQTGNTSDAKAVGVNPAPQTIEAQALADAGRALQHFRNNFYIGFVMVIGGHLIALSAWLDPEGPNVGLVLAGWGIALGGCIVQLLSCNNIGVAGERLVQASGE